MASVSKIRKLAIELFYAVDEYVADVAEPADLVYQLGGENFAEPFGDDSGTQLIYLICVLIAGQAAEMSSLNTSQVRARFKSRGWELPNFGRFDLG